MKLAPAHLAFFIFIITYPSCIRLTSPSIYTEQSPERAWQRLAELKSFHFTLQYHTSTPAKITAQFSGRWENPDREQWDGLQQQDRRTQRIAFRAKGDRQFLLTDSGWQIQPRGLETRILKQIEQILTDTKLTYLNENNRFYRYQFTPKFLIIDPLKTQNLTGILEIEKQTGLLRTIHCSNEQKKTEWTLKIHHFNQKGKIGIPFVPAMTLELHPKDRPQKIWEYPKITAILRRRLDQLGIASRIKWQANTLKLSIDHSLTRTSTELLTAKGEVELWAGEWTDPNQQSTETAQVLQLGVDAVRMVALKKCLGSNQSLKAVVVKDNQLPAKLAVIFSTAQPINSGELFILTVDGRAIAASNLRELPTDSMSEKNSVLFTDIENDQLTHTLTVLINNPPLPTDFLCYIKNN